MSVLRVLQSDGAYVGKRIVNGQTMMLFQLYGFYVEVVYKLYRQDISRLNVSGSADILVPYIDQIKIRDLDKNNEEGKDSSQ